MSETKKLFGTCKHIQDEPPAGYPPACEGVNFCIENYVYTTLGYDASDDNCWEGGLICGYEDEWHH